MPDSASAPLADAQAANSQTAMASPALAYTVYFLTAAFMASNVVFGRAASFDVPPLFLAFARWALAFVIILPIALPGLIKTWGMLRSSWRDQLLLGFLGQGICGGLVYIALRHTTATNAGLIYATSPIIILIIAAIWMRERVAARQILGIGLALAGVLAILARGDVERLLGLEFNIGDLLILVTSTSWALYTVLLRRGTGPRLPVITGFATNALFGSLVLAPFALIEVAVFETPVFTTKALLCIAGLAVISSVLAFTTYQKAVQLMGPSRAGTSLYVMPLWTALMAWALLGEELHLYHLLGAALVLPGVLLATGTGRRPAGESAR